MFPKAIVETEEQIPICRPYRRLRHVCLAVEDLFAAEIALEALFGLTMPFRDPDVEQFGLCNALYAMGGSYLELVAPVSEVASVRRFLARGENRGVYLVAFDCENLNAARERADNLGLRKIFETSRCNGSGFQLHPGDCSGVILGFDHHRGDADRFGPYAWADDSLSALVNRAAVELESITLTTFAPTEDAKTWSAMLGKPVVDNGDHRFQIELDHGAVNFETTASSERCGVQALHLTVEDRATVFAKAEEIGVPVQADSIQICGARIQISQSYRQPTT